jgi:leucyl aminopeptidase (aminopeptidase T)
MNLKVGAENVIRNCLDVQEGEEVLIITDDEKKALANEFFHAVLEEGAHPLLVKSVISHEGHEPPDFLGQLMAIADVILMVTQHSMSHTRARRAANKAGARIANMPDLNMDILEKGGLTADFYEIEKVMRKVYRRIRGGRKVTVSTPLGTDLTLKIKGRKWVTEDIGLCYSKGGFTTLPAGEIFIAPIEGSAGGELIVDGSFLELLKKPARVVVEEGIATKVVGAQTAIRGLNEGGKEGRFVAKLGMGLNPRSKMIGHILEDEKSEGTVNIGFGGNHTFGGTLDCDTLVSAVMLKPTVMVDDITILDKGKFRI